MDSLAGALASSCRLGSLGPQPQDGHGRDTGRDAGADHGPRKSHPALVGGLARGIAAGRCDRAGTGGGVGRGEASP